MRKLSCRVRLAGQVDCIFRFLTGRCAAAGNARPSAAASAVRTSRGVSLLRMAVSLKVDFSMEGDTGLDGRCLLHHCQRSVIGAWNTNPRSPVDRIGSPVTIPNL